MALKTLIPFPILAPSNPSHRPASEVRFSRWNNANAERFTLRERAQKEIEDNIRRERRFDSATRIADIDDAGTSKEAAAAGTFKSTGTPSSPSKPSIPGKSSKYSKNPKTSHPAFRQISRRTKLPGPNISPEAKRGISIGEDGVSYMVPGVPFELRYSYTETPKVKPIALREPPFLPFGPDTMPRPWTGRAPLPPSKKKLKEFDSFQLPPPGKKRVKPVQAPGPFLPGSGPRYVRSREEILGEPLTEEEIKELVQGCVKSKRQLNMGRDGLTHNMLDNIHAHWKRRRVCKIKCKGVCTVDMDNVRQQLEEKTGGKVIYGKGGVLFLFRGRNYNYRNRPRFPLMLWKPVTPVYPRLVQRAPEGLTLEEAGAMRKKGRKLIPICKLAKNGVYTDLVNNVREAFEECELVRINCQGLNASDYRKIGAKLKDLVPCVLISFEHEHILMWRGSDWKFLHPKPEDGCKEAKESDNNSEASIPPPFEGQELSASCSSKISVKDASLDMLDTIASPVINEDVAMDKTEDLSSKGNDILSFEGNDKPFAATQLVKTAYNWDTVSDDTGGTNESEIILTKLDNAHHADDESAAMPVELDTMLENGSIKNELMDAVTHDMDKLQDIPKASQDCGKMTGSSAPCTGGLLILLKQAVDSGSAFVLDGDSCDADIVYGKTVAFSKDAPPGPVFRRPRKAAVQKCEKEEPRDLAVGKIVTAPEKGRSQSKSSRNQIAKDFKEGYLDVDYPGVGTRGTLGVDELAKLLA